MHMYFISRGIKKDVDNWIEHMASQYYQLPYKNKEGELGIDYIQGALRPIQLWEYVFPRDSLHLVLRSININDGSDLPWLNKYQMVLRKMLKAKAFPKVIEPGAKKIICQDNVTLLGIGIKEDKMRHKYPDGIIREFL